MAKKKDDTKPLPLWARALVTLVAGGMLVGLCLVIGLTALLKNQADASQDPKYIAAIAQKIVKLPDPLPKGYTFAGGVDLLLLQVVSIDYDKGKQNLLFIARPTDMDSREMLNDAFQKGFVTSEALTPTEFSGVLSEGGWLIQDTQIPYRLGRLQNNQGLALVACVSTVEKGRDGSPLQPPEPKKTPLGDDQPGRGMILYALQPKGDTFDMKVCTNLLQGE